MTKRNCLESQKTIFIFTEGESEEVYLNRLKRRGTGYRVNIKKMNERNVLDLVIRSHTSAHHSGLSENDEIYVVFDADVYSAKQLAEAEEKAAALNVSLIVSNPCFEVWLLYHFLDAVPSTSSNGYTEKLSRCLQRNYRKSEGIGAVDLTNMRKAIERSRKHCKSLKASDIKESTSCTSMHVLVERLLKDE